MKYLYQYESNLTIYYHKMYKYTIEYPLEIPITNRNVIFHNKILNNDTLIDTNMLF